MSVIVKNVGAIAFTTSGGQNTGKNKQYGGNYVDAGSGGTVRVSYNKQEWVFGPNEARAFNDDGIGIAVAALDSRLRVMDTRDGVAGASGKAVS
jgi:hypothetical protein